MILSGTLEETPLGEVLELLENERRTGTLRFARGGQRARIGFRKGRPISARVPGLPRLGELLVASGFSDPITIREAARIQGEEQPRRPLGQILIARGVLDRETLAQEVSRQIQLGIAELRAWLTGHFEFIPGVPQSDDDLSLDLGESHAESEHTGSGADLRILTDDGSSVARPTPAKSRQQTGTGKSRDSDPRTREAGRGLQIVSSDLELVEGLARNLPRGVVHLAPVSLSSAGRHGEGVPAPVVVIDLRPDDVQPQHIAELTARQPAIPVLAITDSPELGADALEAGSISALPPVPALIGTVAGTAIRLLMEASPLGSPALPKRRQSEPKQTKVTSAIAPLELMHNLSHAVERAVLFFVQGGVLAAAGAFGTSDQGKPLAQLTSGLVLKPDPQSALARALTDNRTQSIPFISAQLPKNFSDLVGAPRNGQIVVFPVSGETDVVAVVYADNGALHRLIEQIDDLARQLDHLGSRLELELSQMAEPPA